MDKIIEVYKVKSFTDFKAELLHAGHFLVAKDFADGAFFAFLQKHGAIIAGKTDDGFVIQKPDTTNNLEVFYQSLDGQELLSY
ncbi:hypothetical protein [Mucilaginibacter panaciglaebae]|uniref:Uncharacterized protein n=1 Tax=Mucilaginibacter panaciglaebae TaxID=502331 RepID=A0ABP7W9H6_9SPHI